MIGMAEAASMLLDQEERSINPNGIEYLPLLIPRWNVAQKFGISAGNTKAAVRLEASRNFQTVKGRATSRSQRWGATDIAADLHVFNGLFGKCARTLVLGTTPKEDIRRLNTSTTTLDRFYLSSTVAVEGVSVMPTLTTHFLGHLMDIDVQLQQIGVSQIQHGVDLEVIREIL